MNIFVLINWKSSWSLFNITFCIHLYLPLMVAGECWRLERGWWRVCRALVLGQFRFWLSAEFFMSDFGINICESFMRIFEDIQVRGCIFHFCKDIISKVHRKELKQIFKVSRIMAHFVPLSDASWVYHMYHQNV